MNESQRTVALVTGASSGIGLAAALDLARAGYAVMLVARRNEPLDEAAKTIRDELGDQAVLEPLAADVTDAEAIERIVDRARERFGGLDAVAHVAGAAPLMPIEQVTPAIWRQCIDSNLSAAVLLTRAVWPGMRGRGGGVIVNVSSMASFDPFPGFAMYAAAKVGVNMFTRCAAREGAACGIRTVAVAPGAVETPLLRQLFSEEDIPRDQAVAPDRIAAVIRDCITGARAFESGQTIVLDDPSG